MQLAFDSADRLVELVAARRGPVPVEDAAKELFALARVPAGIARGLLDEVVGGDARLAWRGDSVGLADPPGAHLLIERARYVVVDLETTGLSPVRSRICEIGAVAVEELELREEFQTFADPGERLAPAIVALTGIGERDLSGAPSPSVAVERFLTFAGDAVLVAHNARFDLGFLDREVERRTGQRLAATVIDTVWLARKLLAGRSVRASLAALSYFFGTDAQPCHRALPDAQATAEILVRLIGLAQERGVTTVAELVELATPQARKVHAKRPLAHGAPQRPGVYLFRDAHDRVLYVGRARDLRARLRSYFGSERQRPSVEAALAVVERIEWRVLGSELEAALEELRLIRELRPPANARGKRSGVYLYRRGDRWVVTASAPSHPSALGPVGSRARARRAARALDGHESPAAALRVLRRRLADYADCLRYEEAARVRDRLAALEEVVAHCAELERLHAFEGWLVAPAVEPGFRRAFLVCGGRVAAERTLPPGAGASVELAAGLAAARRAGLPSAAEQDELLLVGQFLRRPPPELEILPLTWPVAA